VVIPLCLIRFEHNRCYRLAIYDVRRITWSSDSTAVIAFGVMIRGVERKVKMTHLAKSLVPLIILVVEHLKIVFDVAIEASCNSPFTVIHIRRVCRPA
jgi:hypothetical protein